VPEPLKNRIRELLHPKNDPINLPYSIAIARVEADKHSSKHTLEQTEVYYMLNGRGIMHIDDEIQETRAGDVILIPPGAIQWIENNGERELQFIAIVSPPWRAQDDHLAV